MKSKSKLAISFASSQPSGLKFLHVTQHLVNIYELDDPSTEFVPDPRHWLYAGCPTATLTSRARGPIDLRVELIYTPVGAFHRPNRAKPRLS